MTPRMKEALLVLRAWVIALSALFGLILLFVSGAVDAGRKASLICTGQGETFYATQRTTHITYTDRNGIRQTIEPEESHLFKCKRRYP